VFISYFLSHIRYFLPSRTQDFIGTSVSFLTFHSLFVLESSSLWLICFYDLLTYRFCTCSFHFDCTNKFRELFYVHEVTDEFIFRLAYALFLSLLRMNIQNFMFTSLLVCFTGSPAFIAILCCCSIGHVVRPLHILFRLFSKTCSNYLFYCG
jgi:hypothetical protein